MLLGLIVVILLGFIYRSWFLIANTLSSGDFPYLFLENIREFSFFPNPPFFWLTLYHQAGAKILVEYLGLTWNFAEKILWFWPFLVLSITSSYYLTRSWIGVLIYTASTYPLMLVGGGQIGVGVAYALAPLVLKQFIDSFSNVILRPKAEESQKGSFAYAQDDKWRRIVLAGLILGVQVMFDPRIAYITFIAIFLYLFLAFFLNTNKKIFILKSFFLLIPIIIALVLNSFWIMSVLKYGFPFAHEGYSSILGFQFLSFADFSHSISILHPNWPENIFGKVYFMKSEFVLLPILAYSSLLFLKKSKDKNQKSKLSCKAGSGFARQVKIQNYGNNATMEQSNNEKILFFALVGLLGAFLAKGANEPFGFVNEFLFQNFPGMNMFRDATKFYTLTVLSYSVLIPISLLSISEKVSSIKHKVLNKRLGILNAQFLILSSFIVFWLFLIRPAIVGELGGTFKTRDVPKDYIMFKDFINAQPESLKTLWVPQVQRFGFSSLSHPALSANELYGTSSSFLNQEDIKSSLIKYIIVPLDSEKEIFLEDRKYDERKRIAVIKNLGSLSWLRKIPEFGDLAVFEVK